MATIDQLAPASANEERFAAEEPFFEAEAEVEEEEETVAESAGPLLKKKSLSGLHIRERLKSHKERTRMKKNGSKLFGKKAKNTSEVAAEAEEVAETMAEESFKVVIEESFAVTAKTPESRVEEAETKFVSTLLTYGLYSYKWSKALALSQAPAIDSPLQWLEEKVVKTTTLGLKQVALTPEGVVAKLDGKASELNAAYELDAKFASSKTWSAKQLLKIKGEDAMTAELTGEIELQQLIADARAVAWDRVSGLQTRVTGLQTTASDKVDTLLEGAESYVEKVLPAKEEGEAQAFEADADATKASRVRTLSTTVTRRFKKKALAKLAGVTLQLRDTQKIHLDLVRYSELLDIAAVRERVTTKYTDVSDTVQASTTYAVVKGYVLTASDTTAKLSAGIKSNVEIRVLAPAKEFYAIATAEFIKRKASANDLIALGSESIGTRTEFATNYLESVKAALGSQWNDRLKGPTMKFLEKCEAEWAPLRTAYNEGVDNTTADGKPLTIDAGVGAFVEALKMKLVEEWELHVVPALQRLKGSKKKADVAFIDLDSNEAVFVDAQNA